MKPLYKEQLIIEFIKEYRKNSDKDIDEVINSVTTLDRGRRFLKIIAGMIY